MSADPTETAIESAVTALPGVAGVYPLAPRAVRRVALALASGRAKREVRVAVDTTVPARELVEGVAAAARAAAGDDALPVHVEIASFD